MGRKRNVLFQFRVKAEGSTATQYGGKPVRSTPCERRDRASRTRRRTRTSITTLVQSKERSRTSSIALRRSWYRQVSSDGSAAGTSHRRVIYALTLFLLLLGRLIRRSRTPTRIIHDFTPDLTA